MSRNNRNYTVENGKYFDEDGIEIVPVSFKDFMTRGGGKTDQFVLRQYSDNKDKPTSQEERDYRDYLLSKEIEKLKRQTAKLEALQNKQTPTPSDPAIVEPKGDGEFSYSDGTRVS